MTISLGQFFRLHWRKVIGLGAGAGLLVLLWHYWVPIRLIVPTGESLVDGSTVPSTIQHQAEMFLIYLPITTDLIQTRNYLTMVSWPDTTLPLNPYPPHQATAQSPNLFLDWRPPVGLNGDIRYELYFDRGNVQPATLVPVSLTEPGFVPPPLEVNTDYSWQVISITPDGVRIPGPVWHFRTDDIQENPAVGTTILIPEGEFLMGCDRTNDHCLQDEEPLHPVYLDAYEIDKFEITNREYRQCVDAQVCRPPLAFSSPHRPNYFYDSAFDYYPVMYVSWQDGQTYCGWRDMRLPTEAEWEKAARGPFDTRVWPWGNQSADCVRANNRIHCGRATTKVGSFPAGASPYGVMDMSGNVFEWVQDFYDAAYYRSSPYKNPPGPAVPHPDLNRKPNDPLTKPIYTLRGGSYTDNWWYSRVAHRHFGHRGWTGEYNEDKPDKDAPHYRNHRAGFRCARSIEQRESFP